jgi:peroxiredoxin
MINPGIWDTMIAQPSGNSLAQIASEKPTLLVFLRFFGCSFCREAISDIAKRRKKLESQGFNIVFVHMAPDPSTAESFFKKYKLFPVEHISDPEMNFYRSFGLGRSSPGQLLGLMNWIRGFQAAVIEGHGATAAASAEIGDGFQMPGVFVLHKGEILRSFIHKNPYDRPDYEEICEI